MPETESHAPGLGELSRQVRDVLVRFEKLATQLENQFVRRDIWEWQKSTIEKSVGELDGDLKELERSVEAKRVSVDTHATLERRVKDLEDNQRWLIRLIIAFVIMGVLGATIYFGKPGGP